METQYLEAGAGPLLLLLHGHEQGATSWRWVIPALARTHRVLALSLPHGRLSVFPDCGHLPHVEHPDRFATVLGSWLTAPRDHPRSTPSAPSPSPTPSKDQQ